MSFLAPWFVLAGLAAISLPVIFHLFRRTPRGRLPFSTLMFLTPSPPRLTSRSRLDNWPLLLLRGLILALLALTFGRPFLRQLLEQQQDTPAGERTVLLVDTSASMRRGELFKLAIAAAEKIVERAGVHDELAILSFGTDTRTLLTFESWRTAPPPERSGLGRAALAELKPSWSATRLDQALVAAVETLDVADQDKASAAIDRRRRVVLVSDLQAGSRLTGLQSFEWPKRIELELLPLERKGTNAGVHALAASVETTSANSAAPRPRVLVINAGHSQRETFELQWKTAQPISADDESAKPVSIYVPPGQSRVVRTPPVPAGHVAELTLSGDDEPFDNSLWFVPPTREQVRVLHLSSEPSDDPQTLRYFLERALGQGLSGRVVSVETVDPHGEGVRTPTAADLDQVPLVVVATDRDLPAGWLEVLQTWIERGGIAVGVATSADVAPWRALLPQELAEPARITLAESDKAREYALLSDLDLRHPFLTPFNDPRFSDFTKIRIWKHRRITLDDTTAKQVRILARFDSGEPAWIEAARGSGRVLVLAHGWQPRESQLGVSSKFVPLMATLVEQGWRKAPPAVNYDAGTIVDLSRLGDVAETPSPLSGEGGERSEPGEGALAERSTTSTDQPPVAENTSTAATKPARATGPWTIKTPSGRELTVADDAPRFEPDEGPGVYEVRSAAGLQRVAINVPVDESKTARLGPEVLETLGVRLVKDEQTAPALTVAEKQTLQSRQLEARQQLWRWCLVFALGMTLCETWYAGHVARRERVS
ncbi:MAG: BatA domain-containing protein [Planctomycetaceae bacterium]|nr:BatA domain-containing protein [Planctomycetaceae bacterium]